VLKEKIKPVFPAVSSFFKDNWQWGVLLLYGTALLAVELSVCCLYGINKTFFNPFIQAWPFILLIYGVGRLIPGWAGKLYFSFFIVLSTTLTFICVFLLNVFNLPLTADIYFVLAASSVEESREFMSNFVNWKIWLALLVTLAFAVSVLILVWKSSFKRSKASTVLALALMAPLLINVIRFIVTRDWPPLYKRNLETEMPVNYFIFRHSLDSLVSMATHPKLPGGIRKKGEGKICGVLVVGESATRNHWGLYGYFRNTTPEMEKLRKNLLIFDNAVSPHVTTTPCCRMMFSTAEYPDMEPSDYTAFAVLKAAGFRIICISNQFRLGSFDGPVNILYTGSSPKEFLQEHNPDGKDEAVIARVKKYISETEAPMLIIVHLLGSHAKFNQRYPQTFDKFGGMRHPHGADFSEKILRRINEYDNSILYTDHILGRIAGMLSELKYPGYMLYVSDHGECPESPVGRSEISTAHSFFEVPMIFYGNEQYWKSFPAFMQAAGGNTGKPYMTDWLVHSIISTAQVTHDGFPAGKDIFSAGFKDRKKRHIGGGKRFPYQKNEVGKPFFIDRNCVEKPL
jgi:heptose-I-phosphate ethanolaminephosphotransferase